MLTATLPIIALAAATPPAAGTPPCIVAPAEDFAAAIADPAAAIGRCVTLEGAVTGRLLVADGDARYRAARMENDPSSTGAAIGLIDGPAVAEPRRMRVTGRIGSCDQEVAVLRERDRATGSISLLDGYCGWYRGLVLRVERAEDLGPFDYVRRTRAAAGPELGNLAPMAAGDDRRRLEAAAQRLLGAIRAGDAAALRAMHGGQARAAEDMDEVVSLLLTDADSPFAPLRGDAPVTVEIFGWKAPPWADAAWHAERERTGSVEAIACFSAQADAASLWPIDSKDADNLPGRPYACTRIRIGGTGLDAPAAYDSYQARGGAREPTTFTRR